VANPKKLVIAVCITLLLFASCRTPSHGQVTSSSSLTLAAGDVRLVIDYGNSTQRVFPDLSGSTVFDVLNETTNVTYTVHAFGRFIQSINGVANNAGGNGYYWQYWVNDQLAPVAADYYVLSSGDDVLWKYCAPGQTGPGLPQGMPDWWIGLFVILGVGGVLAVVTALVARKSR
jgi:hypothetical protein